MVGLRANGKFLRVLKMVAALLCLGPNVALGNYFARWITRI